jgi:hypothetical protein
MPAQIDYAVRFGLIEEAVVALVVREGASVVSIATVAEEMGVGRNTVRRSLRAPEVLLALGLGHLERTARVALFRASQLDVAQRGLALARLLTQLPTSAERLEWWIGWRRLIAAVDERHLARCARGTDTTRGAVVDTGSDTDTGMDTDTGTDTDTDTDTGRGPVAPPTRDVPDPDYSARACIELQEGRVDVLVETVARELGTETALVRALFDGTVEAAVRGRLDPDQVGNAFCGWLAAVGSVVGPVPEAAVSPPVGP